MLRVSFWPSVSHPLRGDSKTLEMWISRVCVSAEGIVGMLTEFVPEGSVEI